MPRRPKPVEPGSPVHVSVMLDADLVAEIDAEALRLTGEQRKHFTRTDVVRRWLEDAADRRKAKPRK